MNAQSPIHMYTNITHTPRNRYSGQFIIEYVGESIDHKEFKRRFDEYNEQGHKHFYFMTLSSDEVCGGCRTTSCPAVASGGGVSAGGSGWC